MRINISVSQKQRISSAI